MNKHPSAQKRHRQSVKRQARNTAIRSRVRTAVRRLRESIAAGNTAEATERLPERHPGHQQGGDARACFHRNTASRKISRLTLAVRKLAANA